MGAMAPAQKRQHAPNFSGKIVPVRRARAIARNTDPDSKSPNPILAKVCVTSPKIRADDSRRAQLCHHVEAQGRRWRACTQIPRQTCCKNEARMSLRERARKNENVSGHPSEDPKESVMRNERATPRNPALSIDSSARRANLEAAGGAL